MPHIFLEYSDNIFESDFVTLFERCHAVLTQQLPTQLESCKSRALQHSVYYVGNGNPQNAFVSVSIKILPGRSEQTLQKVNQELMKLFKNFFSTSLQKLNCQITLEITEISKYYCKL
jgi:5-carboxymethyl-2-hydroxymuconate isomerase